jgi:Zn-dependent peptidase ImmA (M78 family)/DNA-binding XRE family transcriptional regulator
MVALITPSVLIWAREQSGFSQNDIAIKLKKSLSEIAAWENGEYYPSISQARKLSEIYRRPLAVFYLPQPPAYFETLRDYRKVPDQDTRAFSHELYDTIRRSSEHQEWLREFLSDEGIDPLEFVGSANLLYSVSTLARVITETIGVTSQDQRKAKTRGDALRLWIKQVESKGVFVSRKGSVDPRECRGFAISDNIAPFIYLNSDDADAAQLFTLIHELVHIWIGSSGISNMNAVGSYSSQDVENIEKFCNHVASLVLLDDALFMTEWSNLRHESNLEYKIERLSQIFKVSEEVIARRLLQKSFITSETYNDLRQYYQERLLEIKEILKLKLKEKAGGPSYYTTILMNNGHSFTRTVLGAYGGGNISGRDASSLLNVKVNNLGKLAVETGFRLPMSLSREV